MKFQPDDFFMQRVNEEMQTVWNESESRAVRVKYNIPGQD